MKKTNLHVILYSISRKGNREFLKRCLKLGLLMTSKLYSAFDYGQHCFKCLQYTFFESDPIDEICKDMSKL